MMILFYMSLSNNLMSLKTIFNFEKKVKKYDQGSLLSFILPISVSISTSWKNDFSPRKEGGKNEKFLYGWGGVFPENKGISLKMGCKLLKNWVISLKVGG